MELYPEENSWHFITVTPTVENRVIAFAISVSITGMTLLGIYRPRQPNWEYRMWKLQDFSATQKLCEINFGHYEVQKTVNLTI